MDSLEKLVELFKKFPGIGPRQARRFAYHILKESPEYVQELSTAISHLKNGILQCELCARFFAEYQYNKDNNSPLCKICADQNRDHATLMIVTQDTDISAIEQRKMYSGVYFVVGGTAELGQSDPSSIPRLSLLLSQLSEKRLGIREIILAMNANTEGEHTADIIKKSLKEKNIRITALGRGLSTGTELEYSDADTLKSAIENRK